MKPLFKILFLFVSITMVGQTAYTTQEVEVSPLIKGNLITPNAESKTLVILIAGSGPTNRNGNQPGLSTNCYKYLGQQLAQNGIAFFSYDKRIIAQMINKTMDESKLRFEDMVVDATAVVDHFKATNSYSKIIIIGHSEGSLIGMLTAQKGATAYISISGPGRPADQILTEQLTKEQPELSNALQQCIDAMKTSGKWQCETKIENAASIFRPTVIPYLLSWFQYNPYTEIQKLKIPVLLINGDQDLQVQVKDAELLKKALPSAQLEVIKDMNHVLKHTPTQQENIDSYTNGTLPVEPKLVAIIADFIQHL
ncbi:MAG: hypothetical protein RLZZ500_1433 [Bacteroidota bacterium]